MSNEINDLMDLDPLSLTPDNIDSIIAYYRKSRAQFESGSRVKKESGPKLSLDGILDNLIPKTSPAQKVDRRI